jgi:hypothetical protein
MVINNEIMFLNNIDKTIKQDLNDEEKYLNINCQDIFYNLRYSCWNDLKEILLELIDLIEQNQFENLEDDKI